LSKIICLTSARASSVSATSSHMLRYIDGRFVALHQLWLIEMTKSSRFSTKWYQLDGLARSQISRELGLDCLSDVHEDDASFLLHN
jgi:hypothetical protein